MSHFYDVQQVFILRHLSPSLDPTQVTTVLNLTNFQNPVKYFSSPYKFLSQATFSFKFSD